MARTSSDTHTALLLNRITNYLAYTFLFIIFITIIVVYSITYAINRDCSDPYKRHMEVFGYWIDIDAGSNDKGCPTP